MAASSAQALNQPPLGEEILQMCASMVPRGCLRSLHVCSAQNLSLQRIAVADCQGQTGLTSILFSHAESKLQINIVILSMAIS